MVDYVKHQDEDEPPSYEQGADTPQQQQNPQQGYPPQQGYQPQQGYPPQQVYPPAQGQPGQGYVIQQYPQQQVVVVQQGYQAYQGFPPKTNIILARIAALCFFWPIGLVAVLKAREAQRCVRRGDYEGGRRIGEEARKLAIAAIITQLVLIVAGGIIYFVAMVAGSA